MSNNKNKLISKEESNEKQFLKQGLNREVPFSKVI